MGQKFKNNARARLASAITASDTSIVIEGGYGDLFPVANLGVGASGDWFKATLEIATGEREIVKVRTRANGSDVFSDVVGAQEGTTALICPTGTVIGLRFKDTDPEEIYTAATTEAPYTAVSGPTEGPGTGADKTKIYQSSIGEYWMWLGNAWKVVHGHWRGVTSIASSSIPASTQLPIVSITAPRDGRAIVRGVFSALSAVSASAEIGAHIRTTRGASNTLHQDSIGHQITSAIGQTVACRPYTVIDVLKDDVLYLLATTPQPLSANPTNSSSIFLEYVQ